MAVKYVCRHCRTTIGELIVDRIDEAELGFHVLTPEERRDIISYNPEGDTTVKIVCEYCKQALDTHPELSLLASPLQ